MLSHLSSLWLVQTLQSGSTLIVIASRLPQIRDNYDVCDLLSSSPCVPLSWPSSNFSTEPLCWTAQPYYGALAAWRKLGWDGNRFPLTMLHFLTRPPSFCDREARVYTTLKDVNDFTGNLLSSSQTFEACPTQTQPLFSPYKKCFWDMELGPLWTWSWCYNVSFMVVHPQRRKNKSSAQKEIVADRIPASLFLFDEAVTFLIADSVTFFFFGCSSRSLSIRN